MAYKNALKKSNCLFSRRCYIDKSSSFGGHNKIIGDTQIYNCEIGFGTYIGTGCLFKNTKFGKFCSIGADIKVLDGNHPTSTYVSTYPAFYRKEGICYLNFELNDVFDEYSYTDIGKRWFCEIGNDVWIGSSVSILNGIRIGDGAIIAAGSVVTKDVDPYSIVAGVPAKRIKLRFEDEEVDWLLRFKWWDKDISWLKDHSKMFSNIIDFKQFCEGK